MSKAHIISTTATSTGNVGPVALGAVEKVSAAVVHASTKTIAWRLQGDIGNAGAWTNLNAAATTSTGSAIVTSTLSGVFTKVRVNVSGNNTTGNVTTYWHIVGA